jgi:hypothetical protein
MFFCKHIKILICKGPKVSKDFFNRINFCSVWHYFFENHCNPTAYILLKLKVVRVNSDIVFIDHRHCKGMTDFETYSVIPLELELRGPQ